MKQFSLVVFLLLVMAMPAWAAPTIVPDSGPIGIQVTIKGEGFGKFSSTKQNEVLFGKAAALVEHWDNNKIQVRVPLKAATGPVLIKQGKKTRTVGTFTVEGPVVKEVSPAVAPPGQVVQIIGRNFGPTMGQIDRAMQFGVNEVLFNGVPAEVVRWRDSRIEVKVPSNAATGPLVVRLASVDPLPDGSCCAPVQYSASTPLPFTVVAPILVEPTEGPLGTPVVISGSGFGEWDPKQNGVFFSGIPAPILEWANTRIRVQFPLKGTTGPVTVKMGPESRTVGEFRLAPHHVIGLHPESGPIGTRVTISGEHFGILSDSGPNQVLFGGVPGRIYQWTDRLIDVWVPMSAKSGRVVVRRGAGMPKPDGSCCAEQAFAAVEAGEFAVTVPKATSLTPQTAMVGSVITIQGSGFGEFIKGEDRTQDSISRDGHLHKLQKFTENVGRTAVLFPANPDLVKASHVAGYVESWTDSEIKVHVPQVAVPGEVLISRAAWDLLPDGTCCKDKEWVQIPVGFFSPKGQEDIEREYRKNIPKLGGESGS
jgi:hypothetical protein